MDAVFAQSLSYCWIMNTDLNWGKWGLHFFRCCSGFFYDLLDESSLRSWNNFGRPASPGKVHHCSPSFLHLWIIALIFWYWIIVRWSPKALEMAFITLSKLIHVNYCSWISLDCSMMCCSLSMLHFLRQVMFKWFLNSTGLAVIRPGFGLVQFNSAF